MSNPFASALTDYTPTDNSKELSEEASSIPLFREIQKLYQLNRQYPRMRTEQPQKLIKKIAKHCPLLYNSYDGILKIWMNSKQLLSEEHFLNMVCLLNQIEVGKLSQHEASIMVGKILNNYLSKFNNKDTIDETELKEQQEAIQNGYREQPTSSDLHEHMTFSEWKKKMA